jgi:hypothetical protein
MSKIEIPEETAKFLVDLYDRLKNQDSRCTASPFYYCVRVEKEIAVPDGCGVGTKYYNHHMCENYELKEVEELYNDYKNGEGGDLDFDEWLDEFNYTPYNYDYSVSNENFFFTKEGYDQHMELNGRNYRIYNKHYSYVDHAFRNPELEGVLKSLNIIGEELKKNEL